MGRSGKAPSIQFIKADLRITQPPARHDKGVRSRSNRAFFLSTLGALCSLACVSDLGKNATHAGPIEGDFAVSDYFSASGFMGDGETRGFLTQQRDEDCPVRRAGALGSCFHFTYNVGDLGWSGVYFQYPANNWGTEEGREFNDDYVEASFDASAEYSIVRPPGAGQGASCNEVSECRPGFDCTSGQCQPAASTPLGGDCLISAECEDGLQCGAQTCQLAGGGGENPPRSEGEPCPGGRDVLCASGLRCGRDQGDLEFVCLPDGSLDLGSVCQNLNECHAGLYCRSSDKTCQPRTELGEFTFVVGGIADLQYEYADSIRSQYRQEGIDSPPPFLSPERQSFSLPLPVRSDSSQPLAFDNLIGGFMWSTAVPDIDEIRASVAATGKQIAYKANINEPFHLYFDNIVYTSAASAGMPVAGPNP